MNFTGGTNMETGMLEAWVSTKAKGRRVRGRYRGEQFTGTVERVQRAYEWGLYEVTIKTDDNFTYECEPLPVIVMNLDIKGRGEFVGGTDYADPI